MKIDNINIEEAKMLNNETDDIEIKKQLKKDIIKQLCILLVLSVSIIYIVNVLFFSCSGRLPSCSQAFNCRKTDESGMQICSVCTDDMCNNIEDIKCPITTS
jgi:hypothetical protein